MTPKFYLCLWGMFAVAFAMFWLLGAASPVVVVAFGFVAFGLIFAGMMCVLPGVVAHPAAEAAIEDNAATLEPATADRSMASVHFPLNPRFH